MSQRTPETIKYRGRRYKRADLGRDKLPAGYKIKAAPAQPGLGDLAAQFVLLAPNGTQLGWFANMRDATEKAWADYRQKNPERNLVYVRESLKQAAAITKRTFELFKDDENSPMVRVNIQSAIALLTGALRGHP